MSLTVIGGAMQIANIKPNDISVSLDFDLWSMDQSFYKPKVSIPYDILNWRDLSPRKIELGVAREAK